MSYSGYLLKLNGITLPNSYIKRDTYACTPKQHLDSDAWTDANGKLVRSVLPHKRTSIEFETKMLSLADKTALQAILPTNSRVTISVIYWNDQTNTYSTGTFYMADVQYRIYAANGSKITYNPIKIELTEY